MLYFYVFANRKNWWLHKDNQLTQEIKRCPDNILGNRKGTIRIKRIDNQGSPPHSDGRLPSFPPVSPKNPYSPGYPEIRSPSLRRLLGHRMDVGPIFFILWPRFGQKPSFSGHRMNHTPHPSILWHLKPPHKPKHHLLLSPRRERMGAFVPVTEA